MRNYLFDAFPLLCWLQEERGYQTVDELLDEAEKGSSAFSIHIVNLAEVYCRICRLAGTKQAEETLAKIRLLPIRVLSVSDEDVMGAAKIKGKYPISYADAFVVAKALQTGATVVTGDPEYKVVSKLVKILWIK